MLSLEIVTPQRKVLEAQTEWVTLPGSEGEMGILPEHIPLMTTLETGIVTYAWKQGNQSLAVHWGYAQVEKNRVTVLAELAESAEDIDVERARDAETRAKEELSQINLSADDWESEKRRLDKYELKLKRSLVRQQASSLQ